MSAKIILGIDPGSHFTGFGVIRTNGVRVEHLSHGVITLPVKLSFNERIAIIAGEIEVLLERMQPDITVVEKIFLGKNADSAFKLGHARGVVIAAAIKSGCEVVEYATRSVKKGVTGNGGASKEQVQMLLFAALGLKTLSPNMDASDALALAFYHARHLDTLSARESADSGADTSAHDDPRARSHDSEAACSRDSANESARDQSGVAKRVTRTRMGREL